MSVVVSSIARQRYKEISDFLPILIVEEFNLCLISKNFVLLRNINFVLKF